MYNHGIISSQSGSKHRTTMRNTFFKGLEECDEILNTHEHTHTITVKGRFLIPPSTRKTSCWQPEMTLVGSYQNILRPQTNDAIYIIRKPVGNTLTFDIVSTAPCFTVKEEGRMGRGLPFCRGSSCSCSQSRLFTRYSMQ